MKTTVDYLDQVKRAHGLTSDYKLSHALGVSRQQISKYRSGRDALSDYTALKVAELLNIDVLEVIASRNAERAKSEEERHAWQRLAGSAAAAIVLALVLAPELAHELTPISHGVSSMYYVKSFTFILLTLLALARACR